MKNTIAIGLVVICAGGILYILISAYTNHSSSVHDSEIADIANPGNVLTEDSEGIPVEYNEEGYPTQILYPAQGGGYVVLFIYY